MNLEKKVLFGVLFVSFSLGFSSQNGYLYQHNKENSYPLTTVEAYTNSTLLPYTSKNLQSFSNNTIVSSKTNSSEIEKSFNDRLRELGINQTLHQFGYNFFLKERLYNTDIPISNNYTLGPGDEIFIYVIGAPPNLNLPPILRVVVDRNGKIYVPNYGVFYVWGLTVKEVEEILSKSLGLNLKVTLGRLRSFPVYVSGEVNSPGPVVVTAANTLIDALSLAKGIKKTGSLRNIQISQQTSQGLKTVDIDLYQILINGRPIDLKLSPGEVILVKTIGPVAAIAGNVRRPGIYELSGKETVQELIEFAGGLSASAYKYKVIIQRYDSNKELKVIEGNLNDRKFLNLKLKDGDLLVIRQIKSLPANAVFIEGYVAYKGPYQYKPGLKLSQLLTQDILLPETNLDYAEIQRYDLKTLQLKKIINFKPSEVLKGVWDIKLQPLDKIIFYPKYAFEPVHISGCVKNPVNIPFSEGLTLSEALAGVKFTTDVKKLKVVIYRKKEFLPTTNVIETNSTYKVDEQSQQNPNLNEYINSKKENRFSKEREPINVVYLYKLLSEGVKEDDIPLRP
ncbi:MAG: SLBB domain-containing protein, partial [Aquificota bacterium]